MQTLIYQYVARSAAHNVIIRLFKLFSSHAPFLLVMKVQGQASVLEVSLKKIMEVATKYCRVEPEEIKFKPGEKKNVPRKARRLKFFFLFFLFLCCCYFKISDLAVGYIPKNIDRLKTAPNLEVRIGQTIYITKLLVLLNNYYVFL